MRPRYPGLRVPFQRVDVYTSTTVDTQVLLLDLLFAEQCKSNMSGQVRLAKNILAPGLQCTHDACLRVMIMSEQTDS